MRHRAYLDSSNARKGPEVTIANPGEVLLYALQQGTGDAQAVVGTVERLRCESHGSIVAAVSFSQIWPGRRSFLNNTYLPPLPVVLS